MAANFKNFALAKLTQNLSSSATTANVDNGSALPDANGSTNWFYLLIQRTTDTSYAEIVKVTNKVGNVLTIVREQEGTIGRAFVVGDLAEARLTNQGLVDAFVNKDTYAAKAASDTTQFAALVAKDTALTNSITTLTSKDASLDAQIATLTAKDLSQDVLSALRTKEQDDAMRAANNELFAASGFVHFGKQWESATVGNVNEGLWADSLKPDIIYLGRGVSENAFGASKTAYPVANIAGVTTDILSIGVTSSYDGRNAIKFPQAPDGTVTYDSATGKVTNFFKDIDPKYGNVATTKQEASARAFEGLVKNGDFRLGNDGSWLLVGDAVISNGTATLSAFDARIIQNTILPISTSVRVKASIVGTATALVRLYVGSFSNDHPYIDVDLEANTPFVLDEVITTASTTGNLLIRYMTGTGTITVSNVSIMKVTNEVVTDRVDMWGFEQYLEEVNSTNPFVYPNGLIQSQASTMDGITTTASSRPVTYYAVFDGDTGSKGKGVNWFTATDAQKKAMASNPKNNIIYDAETGTVQQWRLRQRTIAGAGNGDWVNTSATGTELAFHNPNSVVAGQGALDTVSVYVPSSNGVKYTAYEVQLLERYKRGTFGLRFTNTSISVSGGSYFLVCGTVSRLNQGAYHPSFNPSGACKYLPNNHWYSTTQSITSSASCFDPSKTYIVDSGFIATNNSGRHDGRFYDAIYASGQGGVCRDMRYSAWGLTAVDFAEADLKVKNGSYRGFEKRVFSIIGRASTIAGSWNSLTGIPAEVRAAASVGDTIHVLLQNSTYRSVLITGKAGGYLQINQTVSYAKDFIYILESRLSTSVGGSFLQTDVIGNPANILATPALADGWQGSWIPTIPDGTNKEYIATRKSLITSVTVLVTDNLGETWFGSVFTLSSSANSALANLPSNAIRIWHYQAFAKQTESANNAVVYGGADGVGQVFATSDSFLPAQNRGTLLKESLIGGVKGFGNGYTNGPMQVLNVKQLTMNSDKLLSGRAAYDVKHDEIVIDGGTIVNGVKALDYNVSINQQAYKQYAATELKHNGTDWGDDSKVTIVDGESTKTDLNGNTVKVVTHKLKEPLGWVKNNK